MTTTNHNISKEELVLIAHDIRNILHRIHSLNNLLSTELEKMNIMVVNELLMLSKFQCETAIDFTSKLIKKHKKTCFSLNKLMQEIFQSYQLSAKKKRT